MTFAVGSIGACGIHGNHTGFAYPCGVTVAEITALLMGAAALAGLWLKHRETGSRETASQVESISRLLADLKSAHDQIDMYRDQLESSRDQEDDCQDRLTDERRKHAATMAELGLAVQKCAKLEAALPSLQIAAKIEKLSPGVRRVLDKCRDGIVLSSIAEEGRFVYVNRTFADAIGRTVEEVITAGWKSLIHPADMPDTTATESLAWIKGGEVVNRYRHSNGSYVQLRWHFTNYEEGLSLCIVWFERRRGDPSPIVTAES